MLLVGHGVDQRRRRSGPGLVARVSDAGAPGTLARLHLRDMNTRLAPLAHMISTFAVHLGREYRRDGSMDTGTCGFGATLIMAA